VLDPACGSGNFLYLALKCLKDIEHQVNLEAEQLGLERQHDVTGPHNVLGIELNEYAAELARVTVWIGELQWRIQQGYGFKTQPVLEAAGPHRVPRCGAGGRRHRSGVAEGRCGGGEPAVRGRQEDARRTGRCLHRGAARRLQGPRARRCRPGVLLVRKRAGRDRGRAAAACGAGGDQLDSRRRNREVLDRMCATTRIFEAWSDEPWVNDGAAVRVSLVGFGQGTAGRELDGQPVPCDCMPI
jgi:hypothetical protein